MLCLGTALWLYLSKPKKSNDKLISDQSSEELSKQKGNQFEEYVIDLFLSQRGVKLQSRVSDYYKNGKYSEDNKSPDLKFSYNKKFFAIECKFRSAFQNEFINWAENYQIENYKKYEKDNNAPVFIAIGIGGDATKPETTYLIPLQKLRKPHIHQSQLEHYDLKDINLFLNSIL